MRKRHYKRNDWKIKTTIKYTTTEIKYDGKMDKNQSKNETLAYIEKNNKISTTMTCPTQCSNTQWRTSKRFEIKGTC